MTQSRYVGRSLQLLLAVATVCAAGNARAADESTRSGLEEIVVTAERRSESLQQVPLSVTALSAATLAKFNAAQFDDYAHMVPNLSFGTGNTFGITNGREITIRGIAGTNTTNYYINDTPLPISIDPRAVDLARVEVLRGPQGTLFGSSAMGGTVRLITRQPDLTSTFGTASFQGYDVNHGGAGYDLAASYNVPLVDNSLALTMSGFSTYTPGVFTRQYGVVTTPGFTLPPGSPSGSVSHVGNDVEAGATISLTFRPEGLPGLTVTPILMHQNSSSNGLALADYTPDNLLQQRPLNIAEGYVDKWTFAGLTLKYAASFGTFVESSTFFYRYSRDTEDGTESVSIGTFGPPPCDPNVYCASPSPNWVNTNQFTDEARFESNFSGPVQLVLGAYYNKSRARIISREVLPYDASNNPAFVESIPAVLEERAAFGSVTYTPISSVELSAGLRGAQLKSSRIYIADGWINGGPSYSPASHDENATTPRFTAKYKFNESNMVYANAAKGYRIGGQNSALPPICDGQGAPAGVTSYNSDSLWSYEVGTKNSWLDGHLRTRLAGYRINWNGLQQSVLLPCTFHFTENVGAAVSKGAELEAEIAPIDGLALNLGLGYEDAKITSSIPGAPYVVGQPLNGVPKVTASLMADYSVPTTFGTAFVRGQYSYTGSSTSFNNSITGRARGSYSLVNAFLGVTHGPWEGSLFAKNLLDVRANLGDEQSEIAEIPGRARWLISTPRTIGFSLKYRF